MEAIDLLDLGYAWAAARIAAAPTDGLDAPTPCDRWDVRELLDHTIGSLTMLTDPVDALTATAGAGVGEPDEQDVQALGPTGWDRAIADLANRSRRAWRAPGVMDHTFELPIGTMPAPVVASATLLETVMHGWDISQATGEAATVPEDLARTVLEFARQALPDDARGDNFAADLGSGDAPSDRLIAFLGRKPL